MSISLFFSPKNTRHKHLFLSLSLYFSECVWFYVGIIILYSIKERK